MNWKTQIKAALGPGIDEDVLEELAQHAAATYASARADGGDAADAQRRVTQQIHAWAANPALLRRRPKHDVAVVPPAGSASPLAAIAQDTRYAWRLLRRQPAYAALVVATMALGIAATTVLGSVAYGVLLKPLPWADAPRLVRLYENRQGSTRRFRPMMTNGTYLPWRDASSTLDAIGGWTVDRVVMPGQGTTGRIGIGYVTPSLLPMLRAEPALGPAFPPGEDDPSRPPAIVLAHGAGPRRAGSRSGDDGGVRQQWPRRRVGGAADAGADRRGEAGDPGTARGGRPAARDGDGQRREPAARARDLAAARAGDSRGARRRARTARAADAGRKPGARPAWRRGRSRARGGDAPGAAGGPAGRFPAARRSRARLPHPGVRDRRVDRRRTRLRAPPRAADRPARTGAGPRRGLAGAGGRRPAGAHRTRPRADHDRAGRDRLRPAGRRSAAGPQLHRHDERRHRLRRRQRPHRAGGPAGRRLHARAAPAGGRSNPAASRGHTRRHSRRLHHRDAVHGG